MLNGNSDPSRDDSWLAGETAAAMRDFASTVTEAPPLRLTAAFSPAGPRAALRVHAGRRWRTWLAPVAAATAVATLAVSLVLVRDIPNDGVVTPGATVIPTANSTEADPGTLGPAGIPRYYVAIQRTSSKPTGKPPALTTPLVVGDSLTGAKLDTITPPTGIRFVGVTAAGDDRTFVAAGQHGTGAATTVELFAIHLAPGSSHPVEMTSMPISAQPAADGKTVALIADTYPLALSNSGTELAVADFAGTGEMAVKVFSVATGRLLQQWTTTDPSLSLAGLRAWPTLTWIDSDRALAVATLATPTRSGQTYVAWQTVRRLNVGGPANGDLIADGTVLRHVQVGGSDTCGYILQWPPVISADGKTFACTTGESFVSYRLEPGEATKRVVLTTPPNQFVSDVMWSNASGDTLIAEWGVVEYSTIESNGDGVQIYVISHGRSTRLRFPSGFIPVFGADIAW